MYTSDMSDSFILLCLHQTQKWGESVEHAAFSNAVLEHVFALPREDRGLVEIIVPAAEACAADPEFSRVFRVARVHAQVKGEHKCFFVIASAKTALAEQASPDPFKWDVVARTKPLPASLKRQLELKDIEWKVGDRIIAPLSQYELWDLHSDRYDSHEKISANTDTEAIAVGSKYSRDKNVDVIVRKVLGEFFVPRFPGSVHLR